MRSTLPNRPAMADRTRFRTNAIENMVRSSIHGRRRIAA